MAKLTEDTVGHIAQHATNEIMGLLEQEVEAHPLRYRCRELPDDAYEALRERIEFELLLLLREIEIPPK